jgi:hypothetical protein
MSSKQESNNVSSQPSLLGNAKTDLPPSSLAAVASKAAVSSGGGSGVQNGTTAAASASSSANSNKFSMYNINSQFKGKSIEPQQKTNSKIHTRFNCISPILIHTYCV